MRSRLVSSPFGYLRITRNTHGSYRYAPIFLPEDEDKSGNASRQYRPTLPDKNVEESYLGILTRKSSPSAGTVGVTTSRYEERQRGSYERELAKRLGNRGYEILERLADLGDHIVERLCRAYADDELGEREILAARLAAEQLPTKRGWT
jgi:hypothetical protein